MKKLSNGIVNCRKLILAIFIALSVFSVFSRSWVYVENNITTYLSDSTETKQGYNIMNQQFITYATAEVMVENVTLEQAQEVLTLLQEQNGVLSVSFDETEDHYKDNCALYNVSFDGPASEQSVVDNYNALKQAMVPYSASVYSDSFSDLSDILSSQMTGVIIIVVAAVFVVLLFTSSTYAEVLVLLLTFGAAALINMGTHFLLGTISFISNSVAIVMQLALSLDYAIIFCNRYKEEHKTLPIEDAVKSALALSIPEISASSTTTIAGLIAMTFMQFRVGLDLGIALVKAIVISLLAVFLFMPALLVLFGNLIDKTAHKTFVPKISFIGKAAYKARFILPPIFALLVVFSCLTFNKVDYAYSMELVTSFCQSDLDIARDKIYAEFGKNHMLPVMVPAGDYEKEAALIRDLEACDEVNSVLGLATIEAADGFALGDDVTYLDFAQIADIDLNTAQAIFVYYAADQDDFHDVPEDLATYSVPLMDLFVTVHEMAQSEDVDMTAEQVERINSLYDQLKMAQDQLQGRDYSRIIVYIDLPEQSSETFAFLDKVHVLADKYYDDDDVYLTGMSVAARDFNQTFVSDSNVVSILSIVFVLIILFLTFKSAALPILLIFVIQGSIWLNFSTSVWNGTYVYFMCYLIVSAIQMGANIDYAIVISSRYTMLRGMNVDKKAAIIDSLNAAFPTILTSGSLMSVAGLIIYFRVSDVVISGIGLFLGIGTLITIALVLFVLPTLLLLGDNLIIKSTVTIDPNLYFKNSGRTAKRVIAALLAITSIASVSLLYFSRAKAVKIASETETQCQQQLTAIEELEALCEQYNLSQEKYNSAKLDFATGYVTDSVGRDQLEDGQKQYDAGKKTLDENEALYEDSYAQYEAGLTEFEDGQEQLNDAENTYNSGNSQYQEALAQYNDGMAQYKAGLAEYKSSLAEYEEGKAQYEEGKAQYTASKEEFDKVKVIYDAVMPLYEDYQSLEERYQAAVDSGDRIKAAALQAALAPGKLAFEAKLGSFQSMGELLEEMDSAQTQLDDAQTQLDAAEIQLATAEEQLADAKVQLDDAKTQLDEAKVQLDEAKAQLDDGKQQIDAGKEELESGEKQLTDAKTQLDDARAQLDDGQEQLKDAGQQLEDGRQLLEDNTVKLQGSLADLDEYSDDKEKLSNGIEILLDVPSVSAAVTKDTSNIDICHAAYNYYSSLLDEVTEERGFTSWACAFLTLSAILGILSAVLLLIGKLLRLTSVTSILSLVFAGIGLVLWNIYCHGYTPLLCAVVALAVMAVVCSDFISKHLAQSKVSEEPDEE